MHIYNDDALLGSKAVATTTTTTVIIMTICSLLRRYPLGLHDGEDNDDDDNNNDNDDLQLYIDDTLSGSTMFIMTICRFSLTILT